jgi:hypothetical protein
MPEGNGPDGIRIALERLAQRSHAGVPEPYYPVVRARGDQLAVRREGDGADGIRIALERLAQRSRAGVPEPYYSVARARGD